MERRPIIEVKNLTAGYGGDTILERVSFTVYEGEVFVILGGSGCGKSTLLKHLVGLIEPLGGQVIIYGINLYSCSAPLFQQALRKFGVLFQSGALLGSMTLEENVALPVREYTGLSAQAAAALASMKLGLVNLGGYEQYLPSEISGGMKKRAGLARAMALNPKILFFDEPSAGLDPVMSAELDNLIVYLNNMMGTTMVIVTHELQSIFAVAQRVIMLDKRAKGIIAEGDPAYLRDHSQNSFVKQFFNRTAKEKML